jgi:hypothetical protein
VHRRRHRWRRGSGCAAPAGSAPGRRPTSERHAPSGRPPTARHAMSRRSPRCCRLRCRPAGSSRMPGGGIAADARPSVPAREP